MIYHTQRRSLSLLAAAGAGFLNACLGTTPAPSDPPPRQAVASYATRMTKDGHRIHALRAGWVRVKASHRELSSPHFWRIPRIIFDENWSDWMPIIVYAVERPNGDIVLVDTGASPRINDPDYFDCDSSNDWFYRRNLAFDVEGGDTLPARMAKVGLDPKRVQHILITHFHADHMGNLERFPDAEVWVGQGNWPSHSGASTCQLPESWRPRVATFADDPAAGFDRTQVIAGDPRLRLVPLPGHTPGHAGLLVLDGDGGWLAAGDATFDVEQTKDGRVPGITEDIPAAMATQTTIRTTMTAWRLGLLPAHDPSAFDRLRGADESRR